VPRSHTPTVPPVGPDGMSRPAPSKGQPTSSAAKRPESRHGGSVATQPGQRPLRRRGRLGEGPTTAPRILHLEGHVEEFAALFEDAEHFRAAVRIASVIRRSIAKAKAADLPHIVDSIDRLLRQLADAHGERHDRVLAITIPEIRRCYEYSEPTFAPAAQRDAA
jgi:hypothetical protein